jgi:glycosyltransferase involved in cell wall biosynthesis
MTEPRPRISTVVPVYKEQDNIRPFLSRLEPVLEAIDGDYEIIFALDPSPDQTEAVILDEIDRNARIKLLVFSRRFGQPAATMAGILSSMGETCVVIDVDLQDPPELIAQLYAGLRDGYEMVVGNLGDLARASCVGRQQHDPPGANLGRWGPVPGLCTAKRQDP